MPKDTKEIQTAIDLYCSVMEEIKFRIDAIKEVIHAKIMIAQTIGKDIGYLELRMICELIAMGCLIAHGDIKATRTPKFMKRYEADFLIAEMAKLHPDFYPQPMVDTVRGPVTPGAIFQDPPSLASGFLTSKDLIKLYHECGAHLHRGYLTNIIKRKKIDSDYSPIGKAVDKIVRLLNFHRIRLIDKNTQYWVEMQRPPSGKPHASLMQGIKFPGL